jgi:N-acetylmuramoyl-L-alanine amidase
MIFGPFDLSNAADAELLFYYWNKSEPNYDYFRWMASVNGSNFYGYRTSGDTAGWRYVNFDLTAVPTLGNLAGRSEVWIAFYFTSDYSNVNRGAFVDNIVLQKLVNSSITCTNQYKAEYFNNRDLNGVPVVTRCENWPINHDWGNGSPASTVNADNFSVRWTGTAYFNAGTYTFRATADDGVRVWLDGSLLIDAWRDQGATTYESTRQVSAGNHTIKMEYYENGGGALAAFAWHQATNKKVVLDPGHGWCAANPGPNCTITPGAVNNGMNLKEKDVVLDIAFRTKSLLEARGVQVFMTRTGDDPYHTLSYAAQFVNEKAPDLSVSIHANAGGGTGTEACYQGNKTTTEASKALSTQMTNEIASLLTLRNRGIFSEYDTGRCGRGNQLYIHNMNPTAMLIETAFIDTTDDATKLRDRRQDFAQAIANAILRQLGLR